MKKICLLLPILLFMTGIVFSQGFKISGTQLLDANGNNFVMKGVNVPLAWFVSDVNNNIANIKNNTGANCLRIVVTTSTSDNAWQTCVQNCINNKIVPMVELHDVTGNNSASEVNRMANFWASKASFLTRPEIARYVLINIANEWGDWYMSATATGSVSRVTWRDAYSTAVKTIRNAGINTTLVIDAAGYGQDNRTQTLLSYAKDVQAADPKHNCLFSIHMYCEWRINGNSSITTHLPAVKNAGIPVIIGEFGYQHSEGNGICDINESQIISTANANGIGWLAWSWKGNGGGVEYLDLSKDWAGTSLSAWGNTVINGSGGTKTAVAASVFSSTNTAPTVSLTAPAANASFNAPASVTITASAADANGTVSNVQFYNGSTLLGSDATSPYSFSWTNVGAGTYTITARATDNAGAVTNSSARSITVNAGNTNTPPTVSLTAPENNAAFTAPASVTIIASAADANGTVSNVQFYNGSTLLGSDATSPYSFTWTNVGAGTYTITAKATDNAGAVTNSAARSITVSPSIPAGGDITGPGCGSKNSSGTFELSAANKSGATSLSWWFTGSSQSVIPVSGNPYKAVVNYGIFFNGGDVCAGVNYTMYPWYKQYCKSVTVCGSRMDVSFAEEDFMETATLSIAPNPSANAFVFTVPEAVHSFSLVNDLGAVVYTGNTMNSGEQLMLGEQFPAGLYTVFVLYQSGKTESKKLQKIR